MHSGGKILKAREINAKQLRIFGNTNYKQECFKGEISAVKEEVQGGRRKIYRALSLRALARNGTIPSAPGINDYDNEP